jgi:hypothetical protein
MMIAVCRFVLVSIETPGLSIRESNWPELSQMGAS